MLPEPQKSKPIFNQHLAFLALGAFLIAFVGARVFTTIFPHTVVIAGGIHFHHFWYGLIMIVVAGGLGIVHNDPRFKRLYAVVFGLGGGLLGDEVGLLLTFGNYNSILTLYFFVIVASGGLLGILLTPRYRKRIGDDVLYLERHERLIYLGIVIAGLSSLWFASGFFLFGAITLVAGVVITAAALLRHREEKQ